MSHEPSAVEHVLVVEDDADFAALLQSILLKAGFTVTTAYNGEDALVRVREKRPDLITLDIQMPRKSGLHFYRKLKAEEAYRAIPVIVVTALTRDDKDMENLIRSFLEPDNVPHPEAYLEKPVDAEDLLKIVREVLRSAVPANH